MKLPDRWTKNCVALLRDFNKEDVEYLIAGGMGERVVLINPTRDNATKLKRILDDVACRISGGSRSEATLEDLAKPGQQFRGSYYGNVYTDSLNAAFLMAKREFDFRGAFSRSIAVEVDGIPARIVSEDDLENLALSVLVASDGANRAQARS